ncbi:MAG TPA: hypothetical protein VGG33_14860, partial [Polyangia bacterium]
MFEPRRQILLVPLLASSLLGGCVGGEIDPAGSASKPGGSSTSGGSNSGNPGNQPGAGGSNTTG